MEAVRRMIIMLAGLALAMATSVLVMMYGWGVEPQSWVWILGASFVGNVIAQLFIEIGKSKE